MCERYQPISSRGTPTLWTGCNPHGLPSTLRIDCKLVSLPVALSYLFAFFVLCDAPRRSTLCECSGHRLGVTCRVGAVLRVDARKAAERMNGSARVAAGRVQCRLGSTCANHVWAGPLLRTRLLWKFRSLCLRSDSPPTAEPLRVLASCSYCRS